MDLERDARVLPLLPCGALDHVVLPVRQTTGHRFSDVAHEGIVIHSDDLQIETARVLGGPGGK